MKKFKKYSSIDNVITREFMEKIHEEMPAKLEYVVQEKVHGTNCSFLTDGQEVSMAKRTEELAADEQFYGYQEILEKYRDKVIQLFTKVKSVHPDCVAISLFGELFGGRYPHPDVPAIKGTILIQKGVCYCPGHEFYAFDIYVHREEGIGFYLCVDEANALFEEFGFFYARTLMRGTLSECLKYPNDFQSKISEWLGLPKLDDNICEGVVIRPVTPMYLHTRDRVIIKSKNARFAEKKAVKQRNKLFKEPVPYSEELKRLIAEAEAYVNENRLANVVSHLGQVSPPKDFGKIIGAFSKDALEDFFKDHGSSYMALDKCEQKLLNRELNGFVSSLVKKVYLNQD